MMVTGADLTTITKKVTKKWTSQRKREERSSSARHSRREYMYSSRVNQSDVAWSVIPEAYAKASDNGRLPAHARQIFYAARKEIQDRSGRPLDSVYFTQNLLPKFMNAHPELKTNWWVVYDARGHLSEPHTGEKVPLGTLEVDKYLHLVQFHTARPLESHTAFDTQYPTKGPKNRYSAILFVEKEGFSPLFQEVQLAERYDLAIMSTKGQSVVAARRLVDELCHDDVPVLVLHDFDKEGFQISQMLTQVSCAAEEAERVRYRFQNEVNVIDLGLRLEDVEAWGLESESVTFKGNFGPDTITTPEEQEFLRSNRRVELNAFTSPDLIRWIEGKLDEHGIKKLIPDEGVLEDAFRRAYQIAHANQRLASVNAAAQEAAGEVEVPETLADQILDALEDDPARAWDAIVADIAEGQFDCKEENTDNHQSE